MKRRSCSDRDYFLTNSVFSRPPSRLLRTFTQSEHVNCIHVGKRHNVLKLKCDFFATYMEGAVVFTNSTSHPFNLPLSYMCSVAKTTAAITAKNSSKRNPSKTQYCLVSPSVLISLSLSLSTVLLLPAWEFIMIYLYFGKPGVIKHQTVPNRLLN